MKMIDKLIGSNRQVTNFMVQTKKTPLTHENRGERNMPRVCRSGRYFLTFFSSMPGKSKNGFATYEIPEISEWDIKIHIWRNFIVREENGEVQYRTDPESRLGDWSRRLRG